jgi:pyruvate/2-oxoglutarate dehydrogenase complex dihydrolipoamide dehydrogenase (E3) component
VDVRLGVAADAAAVLAEEPDAVIVATGARPDRTGFTIVAPSQLQIAGVELPHVHTGWDVIAGTAGIVGGRVVVLDDDGSRYPASVAEILLDVGCEVELVTRFSSLLPGTVTTLEQPLLYKRLFEKGLAYRINTWVSQIAVGAVTAYELYTGRATGLDADHVVLATTSHPVDDLFHELRGEVATVQRIGDCLAPRKVDHAIYEGFVAGAEMLDDRTIQEGELEAW